MLVRGLHQDVKDIQQLDIGRVTVGRVLLEDEVLGGLTERVCNQAGLGVGIAGGGDTAYLLELGPEMGFGGIGNAVAALACSGFRKVRAARKEQIAGPWC